MAFTTKPTAQDPTYTTRQSEALGVISGANVAAKFATFADAWFYSATVILDTIGTSTYSSTTSAQQVTVFAVVNTSTTSTVGLATTTFGTVIAGGTGSPAQAGGANVLVFNTATGVGGFGGYFIPRFSSVYAQNGTDATAKTNVTLDYQVAPLATVVA